MQSFLKKWLAVCLAVLIFAQPSMHLFAEEPTARNLNVFRVDGDDAFLSWGLGGRGMEPRSGQRLSAGNVMSTGLDTQVYMQLDVASIVKMDEQSQLSVDAAGNRLSLTVLSGSALVEVEQLAEGHTLETRIGGTVMSVRGTLFIAAMCESGAAVFTMLSGEGVVYIADETGAVVVEEPLRAGYVFWAYDYTMPGDFAVLPIDLQTMSLFELQETYNYREYLLRIGTITPAMQQQLPNMNRHKAGRAGCGEGGMGRARDPNAHAYASSADPSARSTGADTNASTCAGCVGWGYHTLRRL